MRKYEVGYQTADMEESASVEVEARDVHDAARLSSRAIRKAGVDPAELTWLEVTAYADEPTALHDGGGAAGGGTTEDPHREGGMAA